MVINDENYKKMITRYGNDIKAVKSVLDPDDTFYYYKDQHIATLRMSYKNGQVGISFKFVDGLRDNEDV